MGENEKAALQAEMSKFSETSSVKCEYQRFGHVHAQAGKLENKPGFKENLKHPRQTVNNQKRNKITT